MPALVAETEDDREAAMQSKELIRSSKAEILHWREAAIMGLRLGFSAGWIALGARRAGCTFTMNCTALSGVGMRKQSQGSTFASLSL